MDDYKFKKGHVPHNTRILTDDEYKFIKENYTKMKNKDLGAKLNIQSKSVYRILKRLGLIRTKEEIEYIRNTRTHISGSYKIRKIENGGRGKHRENYHKQQWIKFNGQIPKGFMLVYENKKYEDLSDLILIKQKSFKTFAKKREKILNCERKNKELIKKEIEKAKRDKRNNEIKISLVNKINIKPIIDEHYIETVPVKIDSKTTIMVKRNRCNKLENGNWILNVGESLKGAFSNITNDEIRNYNLNINKYIL